MPGVKGKQKKSVTISSKIEIGKGAKNRVETVREKKPKRGRGEVRASTRSTHFARRLFPFSHQGA